MSKIGKINITIPEKVKVVLAGNMLNIEGPLGKKSIGIDLDMFNLDIKEGKEISIKPKKIDQNTKRLWGMNRSLINNAVIGSSTGYEKTLELVGVGYRAALKGNQLNLQLGSSHDIDLDIPEGVKIIKRKIFEPNQFLQNDNKTIAALAFNYDRNESDLSHYKSDELSNLINDSQWKNVSIVENVSADFSEILDELQNGKQLWKWFILLTLFFILAEVLISRFMKWTWIFSVKSVLFNSALSFEIFH